tara:strand:+ start:936 stop:1163 length:228 start_codon:yes stop_codon:yes gene_type:complete
MPLIMDLIKPIKKYCFEDNELDIKCKELEQKITDQGFRITTLTDMVKQRDEAIDEIKETLKAIKNKKTFKKIFGG